MSTIKLELFALMEQDHQRAQQLAGTYITEEEKDMARLADSMELVDPMWGEEEYAE